MPTRSWTIGPGIGCYASLMAEAFGKLNSEDDEDDEDGDSEGAGGGYQTA